MNANVSSWFRAGLLTALSAALGWVVAVPEPKVAETRLARRDVWRLDASLQRKASSERVVAVGTAPFWGMQVAAPVAAASAAADDRWRLAGIVGRGTNRRVLVLFTPPSNKAPQLLKEGDMLPTGIRITKVNDKTISVLTGKKTESLPLEPEAIAP